MLLALLVEFVPWPIVHAVISIHASYDFCMLEVPLLSIEEPSNLVCKIFIFSPFGLTKFLYPSTNFFIVSLILNGRRFSWLLTESCSFGAGGGMW